jgi:hypothetical protein
MKKLKLSLALISSICTMTAFAGQPSSGSDFYFVSNHTNQKIFVQPFFLEPSVNIPSRFFTTVLPGITKKIPSPESSFEVDVCWAPRGFTQTNVECISTPAAACTPPYGQVVSKVVVHGNSFKLATPKVKCYFSNEPSTKSK